jgi:hypothetical protein
MTFSYSFTTDWNFYRTALNRYRLQKPNPHRTNVVMAVAGVILLLAWIYGRSSHAFWAPIPKFALIGGVVGGTLGYAFTRLFLRFRLKRSPSYGVVVTVTLDDEGLHAAEPHARTSMEWAAFTRVSRLNDGMMFARGRVARWLPDSALQNATPEEVLVFARSKTTVAEPQAASRP